VALPVLVADVIEVLLEELAKVFRRAEPVGAIIQRKRDQDPPPACFRRRKNQQLLVAEKLSKHDVVGPELQGPRYTLLRCASRTGRRRQQGETPLPMVNVLEQTTLATRRPQIDRIARQLMTTPGRLDLLNRSRRLHRRHQLEGVAAYTLWR
jgi:hypothetical protein